MLFGIVEQHFEATRLSHMFVKGEARE